jgi:hypothetical protein
MNFVKHSFLGAALAGMTLLSGCGLCDCMGGSDDTAPVGQSFIYNGNSWRVADVRGKGRLVIVAVDPRLAGLGTEAAVRHSIAAMPEAEYRAAANGWLTTTGRFCTPGPAEAVNNDNDNAGYQYRYSCWTPA